MNDTKDYPAALTWFQKAAAFGIAKAENNLAIMYDLGQGTATNHAEAAKWFRRSAEHGLPEAQFGLSCMYYDGRGVSKDYVEAAKWCRQAADQGLSAAEVNLGSMYLNGLGVPKDYVEGYKWSNLAAAQGEEDAGKNRELAAMYMTPAQIADAQHRSSAFTARINTAAADITGRNYFEDLYQKAVDPRKSRAEEEALAAPENPNAMGTGFFITADGYLVTNNHVAEKAASLKIRTAQGDLPATVVRVDIANDLALLKAEGLFNPLPIRASRSVRLGESVATIGFPNPSLQGFLPKLSKGDISSLAGLQDDPTHFQVSLPIQPGNSGGALLDEKGNIIGVIVGRLSQGAAVATSGAFAENVNYAIKSTLLLNMLDSVPGLSERLREPSSKKRAFDDIAAEAEQATVLVLKY